MNDDRFEPNSRQDQFPNEDQFPNYDQHSETPAEGNSLYAQGHSPENNSIPQPVYYVEAERAEQTKKRRPRKGLKRLIAVLVVTALLAGTVGTLSFFYEIVPGDDSTVFSLARREWDWNRLQNDGRNDAEDNQTPSETAPPRKDLNGDEAGPEMVIQQPPTAPAPTPIVKEANGELSIAEIAEKVMPSTVGVVTTVDSRYGTSNYSGTGIIMSEDGYIITNNHVINGAKMITITLMDGRTFEGKLIGGDARSDLAVVKIQATGLVPAEFGDSDNLRVGDLAVAIGNPLGLELMGTVTDGIISAINRDVVVEERTMTLIQTNAAINAGNSGGPLINKFGQVIGINTLKMQDYYTNVEGLGFAIPTNTAKEIIDELIEFGYVKGRPAIGISGNTISEFQAKYYNIPRGMVVFYINPKSDAYVKGLKVNDIITKAQGKDVESTDDINKIKEQYVAGDDFTVTVYREGKYFDITFKLMDEAEIEISPDSPFLP